MEMSVERTYKEIESRETAKRQRYAANLCQILEIQWLWAKFQSTERIAIGGLELVASISKLPRYSSTVGPCASSTQS